MSDDLKRWFDDVDSEIRRNLESFTETFFGTIDRKTSGKTDVKVSPCPFCGHNGCFSVHAKGVKCHSTGCLMNDNRSYVNAVAELYGGDKGRAMKAIAEFTAIRLPQKKMTPKQREERDKAERIKKIKEIAVEYYHQKLMNNPAALEKQIGQDITKKQRAHEIQDLVDFKIGLAEDYLTLYNHLVKNENFVPEEVKEAKLFFPDGYFVYPYFNETGELVRMNGKLAYRSCRGRKLANGSYDQCSTRLWDLSDEARALHESTTGHEMSNDIYSTGEKMALFGTKEDNSKHTRKKKVIVVEGENDAIAVHRMLRKAKMNREYAVIALGGSFSVENMRASLLRNYDELYSMFDHDDAGDGYQKKLNHAFPDKPYYVIPFSTDYNDIDDYIKSDRIDAETFKELFLTTEFVKLDMTDENYKPYVITRNEEERKGSYDLWVLKNREVLLKFELYSQHRTATGPSYKGKLYHQGPGVFAMDMKEGSIESISLNRGRREAEFRPALADAIKAFYGEYPERDGRPLRDIHEIVETIAYSPEPQLAISQIAAVMSDMDIASPEYNSLLTSMRVKLSPKHFDALITEITTRRTPPESDDGIIEPIVLSHHFDLTEGFACVYFPQHLRGDFDDGFGSNGEDNSDSNRTVTNSARLRIVPTLLTNDKQFIRLDYMKRKTPQDKLVINGKYVLDEEIEQDPFSSGEVSLIDRNVRKYMNGEYTEDELSPTRIVKDMEDVIRQFYYFPPERDFWYKMLAVWIYGTYYYMLFGTYPYLLIDGVKGSGKSTIDTLIYRLGFNAKLSANSSPAALYRMINQQGGTVILDEMENLYDKKVLDSGDIGSILKSGYSDIGRVYRVSTRNDEQVTVGFRVFGPKVISNINGVDEVLESRCVNLKTPRRVTAEMVADFKDSKLLLSDREWSAKVRDISSRATLSTLHHFKKVGDLYHNQSGLREERKEENEIDKDETPRTSQILAPLLTIAMACGKEYQTAFHDLYREEIVKSKKRAKDESLEGMIQNIAADMAREALGIPTKHITEPNKFDERMGLSPVTYDPETGFVAFNGAQMRVLLEEMDPALYDEEKMRTERGKFMNFRSLSALMKEIFAPAGEALTPGTQAKRYQFRASEEFNVRYKISGRVSVLRFHLHVNDLLSEDERKVFLEASASKAQDDLF